MGAGRRQGGGYPLGVCGWQRRRTGSISGMLAMDCFLIRMLDSQLSSVRENSLSLTLITCV